MKIYFFGSDGCQKCQTMRSILDGEKIKYVYIDALDEDNDNVCNRYGVDELPHTIILDDNNKMIFDVVGIFDTNIAKNKIKNVFDLKKFKKDL